MIHKTLLLALGGALGAVSRYIIWGLSHKFFGASFPAGTLAVNLIGGFLAGFLWETFQHFVIPANLRVFLFAGILGGFTTFSAYSLETAHLMRDGEIKFALINIMLNNFLSIALVFAGGFVSKCLYCFFK